LEDNINIIKNNTGILDKLVNNFCIEVNTPIKYWYNKKQKMKLKENKIWEVTENIKHKEIPFFFQTHIRFMICRGLYVCVILYGCETWVLLWENIYC
jgi:hypothetical protein